MPGMKRLTFIFLLFTLGHIVNGQIVPYGNNLKAGKYINVGDAKLYYEIYGLGRPLLLLHGDTFGYISEFDQYIPLLAKHFKVIAMAMRGHGKSEIGTKEYSYKLFAEDALAILTQEKVDSVTVVGFSAGAITTYYLAAYYPKKVKKAVAMGGAIDTSGYRPGATDELKKYTGDDYEKMLPNLVKSRKKLMPKPDSYNELIDKLKTSWLQPIYVEKEKVAAIKCPVLTVAGDRDDYIRTEEFVRIYKLIENSQLAIIPNCSHVGLILDPTMFSAVVMPFLLQK
jgi:pimeloyl-ACP methyl ester carboxylesterase